jgi:hypothetical protein
VIGIKRRAGNHGRERCGYEEHVQVSNAPFRRTPMGEAPCAHRSGAWRRSALWYNDLMRRPARNVACAPAGYGLAIGLSGVAVVRAWRPERSTVDVAVTAATPWLLAPSWGLPAGALRSQLVDVA